MELRFALSGFVVHVIHVVGKSGAGHVAVGERNFQGTGQLDRRTVGVADLKLDITAYQCSGCVGSKKVYLDNRVLADCSSIRGAGVQGILRYADLTRCRIEDLDVLAGDRKSTRLNSSHVKISYAVFCLKK